MKKIINKIKKELVLKLDFVNMEFEIGWIWIILEIPSAYLLLRNLITLILC